MLRIALLALLVALSRAQNPQHPPEGRHPLDRFHLVKPYTRWINKYQTLGAVMTTMSEIRLTPDMKSSNGAIWTTGSIGLDAFTVEARLRFSARSTAMAADGMGIWFNERTSLGGAYGIAPMFTGFGVVVDIYDNTHSRRTPFIGLVASNGTTVFNNDNNGEAHSLDSCRVYDTSSSLVREGYDHNARESIAVHIEYMPGKIGVYYKLEKDLDWNHCLTYENIFIPKYFYLGVSASTGDLTAQQDLISLKVFDLPVDLTVKARSTMHFEPAGGAVGTKIQTEGGKILSVLFFTLAFFIVIGAVAIIIKPELLPGSSASIDKKKRFY